MQRNDEILISEKQNVNSEPEKYRFLKFSKNVPLNCDIVINANINLKDILITQSTIIVENETGLIKEFSLSSVTIQKLFNKLSDKV